MTKRIIAIIAALLLALSLFACTEPEQTEETTTGNKIEIPTTAGETTADETESEENEETTKAPSADIVFDPVSNENVYVLHKNKAVILHNTPSYSDGATLSVANGTQLVRTGLSVDGEWSKVEYKGATYYIASQAVTTLANLDEGFVAVNKTYTVIAEVGVNVRIAPEVTELAGEVTQYNVIGTLSNGDTVKIIAENTAKGWLKIEFESDEYDGACYVRYNKAWFSGDTAETTEAATEEITTEAVVETEAESSSETMAPAGK